MTINEYKWGIQSAEAVIDLFGEEAVAEKIKDISPFYITDAVFRKNKGASRKKGTYPGVPVLPDDTERLDYLRKIGFHIDEYLPGQTLFVSPKNKGRSGEHYFNKPIVEKLVAERLPYLSSFNHVVYSANKRLEIAVKAESGQWVYAPISALLNGEWDPVCDRMFATWKAQHGKDYAAIGRRMQIFDHPVVKKFQAAVEAFSFRGMPAAV